MMPSIRRTSMPIPYQILLRWTCKAERLVATKNHANTATRATDEYNSNHFKYLHSIK